MTTTTSTTQPLSRLNYLNVLAYIVNAAVTYTIGVDNGVSAKYQTIITPAPFAFAIWGVIFMAELHTVIAQLLPRYCDSDLVVKGMGYNYIVACLLQALWCPIFTLWQNMIVAAVVMLGILVFLGRICWNQYKLITTEGESTKFLDVALLQVPFALHCGWIVAASLLSINVVLVSLSASATVLYMTAILSLVGLLAAATAIPIAFQPSALYMISLVLAWASYGIHKELQHPLESIASTFAPAQIAFLEQGALVLAIFILVVIIVRFVIYVIQQFRGQDASSSNIIDDAPLLRDGA